MSCQVTAISSYVPHRIITNAYFEKLVETSDEWIQTRTGIIERRFTAENEYTTHLCYRAARNLVEERPDIRLEDVDFIMVATSTPDHSVPSVASQVQNELGIKNCGTLDIASACAGFVYGLTLAKGLIAAGTHRKILVFGAENLSRYLDLNNRNLCILFGDAAGVALIEASELNKLFAPISGTEGSMGKDLYRSSLSTKINNVPAFADGKTHQNGRVVFKWVVQNISENLLRLAEKNQISLNQIDWIILHSANLRIIEAVSRQIDFPMEKMLQSIQYFGNTSSASIPLAWHQGLKNGKLKPGDKMLLMGFGGGMTYAGIMLEC
ncbi:ketoacyl-ACP synthase III [Pedobacter sp. SYSU D00535]|uniref:ketoacyl-ACP synthase III n=1 Tax=Pedobacter sp. SYSU D00535 TaxID=2810308 RepID=UPI001A96C682|nr:ketoacyl-ACP synthase III [Pedobacter sp. SYSU D00535]